MPFILDQAKMLIRKGDVVIVSIEYFLDEGHCRLIENTRLEFPEVANIGELNIKQKIQVHLDEIKEGLTHFINGMGEKYKDRRKRSLWELDNKEEVSKWNNLEFNKHGDYIRHLNKDGWYKRNAEQTKYEYRYWEGIKSLNEFKAELKEVDIFFTFPPFAASSFDADMSAINKLKKDFTNDLAIEVVGTPEDFVFEDRYFYDTYYHLTEEGRVLRTKKQIQVMMENEQVRNCIKRASKTQKRDDELGKF